MSISEFILLGLFILAKCHRTRRRIAVESDEAGMAFIVRLLRRAAGFDHQLTLTRSKSPP